MLYNNKPRIIKEGDCDCNEGSKILPQCQLYEPFIGLEKEGKAPEIKYDMRAKHAISTLSSIPIWLNYGKIKAEHLSANRDISPFWELASSTASSPNNQDEILQREFLEVLAGAGGRFGMVKNTNLLECIDPLTVKWHSNTSILELIESFYAQAEKQRAQDIAFALAARERAMSAVEAAQQMATNSSNLSVPDLNNLIDSAIAAANSIFHTNFSNVTPSGGQTPQIPTVPPPEYCRNNGSGVCPNLGKPYKSKYGNDGRCNFELYQFHYSLYSYIQTA